MKSLLLVDDELPVALELRESLKLFGYRVEVACSTESALDLIANDCFDAILIEFNLRSEFGHHARTANGLRLVSHIRTLKVTSPILILTVMQGKAYESASHEAGADDFILKPLPIPILVSLIRTKIDKHQLDSVIPPGWSSRGGLGFD